MVDRAELHELRQHLAAARAGYTGGANPEADLAAGLDSLNAVVVYLQRALPAENRADIAPLIALGGAVEDVASGRECPMLPRRKTDGRPRASKSHEMLWTAASAAVSAFMEDGLSERDAATKVANALEARNLPIPTSNRSDRPNWKSLADWRDKLHRRLKGDDLYGRYVSFKENARQNAQPKPGQSAGDLLLEVIIDMSAKSAKTPTV